MADKRNRIYYTKDQTTTGLLTKGGEWMLTNGSEYVGQYHKYSTGETFTEAVYIDGKSSKLIPYVDLSDNVTNVNGIKFDFNETFEYDDIKSITLKPTKIPNNTSTTPTAEDYMKGYFTRQFASKVNEDRIIELSESDFKKVGKSNGLSDTIWTTFTLRWKISGSIDDILNPNGTIKQAGVVPTNKRTIALLSETYPSLKHILTNLTEFHND